MATAYPPEFRRRAVQLVHESKGVKSIRQIADDLDISESCLRRWVRVDRVDSGGLPGLTTDERAELVRLRRENRVKDMEIEILKKASALFAVENVLPKGRTR